MGEALLALLEGRDMEEAVSAYRKREYIPRRLTIRLGDWRDDESSQAQWFESVMPTAPSAEDEYLDSVEPVMYYEETRFDDVRVRRRGMHNQQSTPSNRRSNRR